MIFYFNKKNSLLKKTEIQKIKYNNYNKNRIKIWNTYFINNKKVTNK